MGRPYASDCTGSRHLASRAKPLFLIPHGRPIAYHPALVSSLIRTQLLAFRYEDQYLSISAQFMVVVAFIGALTIKVYEDVDVLAVQTNYPSMAKTIFGFESTDEIVNLLLSFSILMMFPFLFITLASHMAHDRKVPKILLRSTDRHPELTIERGHKYHLFNSRERCSTRSDSLHRAHELMLPVIACHRHLENRAGCRGHHQAPATADIPPCARVPGRCACTLYWDPIYIPILLHLAFVISDLPSLLAVDDLEDISLLEQYVGESAVMLILLSQGYLLSRNVDDSMSNPSDAAISTACVTHTVFPCAHSASVR